MLHGRSDLARERSSEQRAEARHQQRSDDAPPQGHRLGRLGGGLGLDPAVLEQVGLVGIRFVEQRAQPIHEPLAGAGGDDGRGFGEATGLALVDHALDVAERIAEHIRGRLQPVLLVRVVGGERTHFGERLGSVSHGGLVGFQKRFITRDDEPPHPGLCIDGQHLRMPEEAPHLVRMRDPALVLYQLVRAPVANERDQEQHEAGEAEARAQFLSEGPAPEHRSPAPSALGRAHAGRVLPPSRKTHICPDA